MKPVDDFDADGFFGDRSPQLVTYADWKAIELVEIEQVGESATALRQEASLSPPLLPSVTLPARPARPARPPTLPRMAGLHCTFGSADVGFHFRGCESQHLHASTLCHQGAAAGKPSEKCTSIPDMLKLARQASTSS